MAKIDDSPFGRGGDWCAWCGSDWKEPHQPGCRVMMSHDSGEVISPSKVRCNCGMVFATVPHPEPGHWESPDLMAHRDEMKEARW